MALTKYKPVKRRKSYKKKVPLEKLVKNILYKNTETKCGARSSSDGEEIAHNGFVTRSNGLLSTLQGLGDRNGQTPQRVGDEISLLKCKIRMMLEVNERYSHVTFKIFVVKSAKGDVPTISTLFMGVSNNKMIDNLNYERYTIITQKTVAIRQANFGKDPSGIQVLGGGFAQGADTQSRATKIVTLNIKGTKFAKGGVIKYEDASSQPKMFDYHLLVYAYSNYSTSSTLGFNVGRVNDEVIELFYKDL